jgi:hypothetical protein
VVTSAEKLPAQQKRRTSWKWIAVAVAAICIAVIATVVVWSHVNSVPVKFVNDSTESVILPDCGPDLEQLAPGQTAIINVYQQTHTCSIDGARAGNEAVVGCLVLPSPLEANAVVRISEARAVSRSQPCG